VSKLVPGSRNQQIPRELEPDYRSGCDSFVIRLRINYWFGTPALVKMARITNANGEGELNFSSARVVVSGTQDDTHKAGSGREHRSSEDVQGSPDMEDLEQAPPLHLHSLVVLGDTL
jgi:hypothetical protein